MTSNVAVDTYIDLKLEQREETCFVNNREHILNYSFQHNIDKIQKKIYVPISNDLSSEKSVKLYKSKVYQRILGLINYICYYSSPNLSFAVYLLTTKLSCPNSKTLQQAKDTLTYLYLTSHYTMKYEFLKDENSLMTLVDSSLRNSEDRKFIFGNIIL
eukprot:snap_masked-scaffold_42-processed-gene-2.20-mRNA-1 protein AED:1.00 eAED:1.00 QI:0/-1/0/0/-1/1/1/0/157